MSTRLSFAMAVAALGLAGLIPAGNAVAAPAPAWQITTTSYPTNFVPGAIGGKEEAAEGPGYYVQATNGGGAQTSGLFTITDVLPNRVVPVLAEGGIGIYGVHENPLSCSLAGQTVTCTALSPTVKPGEVLAVNIPVKVKGGGAATVTNEASVTGGGASKATALTKTTVGATLPNFDFVQGGAGLYASATNSDGKATSSAGSHPYQLVVGMNFPSEKAANGEILATGGGLKDISVDLPSGVVANPEVTPAKCTEAQLESVSVTPSGEVLGGCPIDTQIGAIALSTAIGRSVNTGMRPVYNMVSPYGSAGEFGFEVIQGVYVHLLGRVRSDGKYELSASANDVLSKVTVVGTQVALWGNPTDASHDSLRGECALTISKKLACPVPRRNVAFLTTPSACSGTLVGSASADSWEAPLAAVDREFQISDLDGSPIGVEGCSNLDFSPSIGLKPETSAADSPTGLSVALHIP